MLIEFKNKKINIQKLLSFGFIEKNDFYIYSADLMDAQMKMVVTISKNDTVSAKVFDNLTGDEYVLHLVERAVGSFVGKVRDEYEAVLKEISLKCYENDVYKTGQAKEVIKHITEEYKNELEFPWNDENSVLRRADNNKWYAVFLKISARKIGIDRDDIIEVLNIKMEPLEVERLVDNKKYFPAYHMNKKHWVTIPFGGYLSTTEILEKIEDSYKLCKKR